MKPECELDNKVISPTIMDNFLKLYENNEKWKDIQIDDKQPTKIFMHIGLEKQNIDVM